MAVVWRATHTETDRPVALKLVRRELVKDDQVRDMFVREARVGARIGKNQHIVDFLDAGIDPMLAVPFLVMELLEGEPLDARIAREGPVSHAFAADIVEQLADALDQAHGAGVFHRDLKPQNLFLSKDKKLAFVLKVLDFGIAKLSETVSQSSTHVGTPAYSAPEQLGPAWRTIAEQKQRTIAQQISAATDVWAMGLVTFEMLTGAASGSLWGATTLAELPLKMVLEPTPLATVRAGEKAGLLPPGFDAWIARCLDIDAAKRFQSAGEASTAIVSALRASSSAAPAARLVPPGVAPGLQAPAVAAPVAQAPVAQAPVAQAPVAQVPAAPAMPAATPGWPAPHPQAAPQTPWPSATPAPREMAGAYAYAPQPVPQPPMAPQAWPSQVAMQAPGQGWPAGPDPRLAAWAAHHRAELRAQADPRFYQAWSALQFLPPIQHVYRDARLSLRDAQVYLAEVVTSDALRSLAGEDRYILSFVVSQRLLYRAALRSKNSTGLADGIGQMLKLGSAAPSLGDPVLERAFELRFPSVQEGNMALPFPLRQALVNNDFRGTLELFQGSFIVRRQDATRFDPVDLDKLLVVATAVYGAIVPA